MFMGGKLEFHGVEVQRVCDGSQEMSSRIGSLEVIPLLLERLSNPARKQAIRSVRAFLPKYTSSKMPHVMVICFKFGI
jgi:hypothetical protein